MVTIFILGFFLDFFSNCFCNSTNSWSLTHFFGFDPIWLALMFAINLQTSFLDPAIWICIILFARRFKRFSKNDRYLHWCFAFYFSSTNASFDTFWYPSLVTWLPSKL